MSVCRTGLYSGNFAMNMRSAMGAVFELPLKFDARVKALRVIEPDAADREEDSDHSVLWLILAD